MDQWDTGARSFASQRRTVPSEPSSTLAIQKPSGLYATAAIRSPCSGSVSSFFEGSSTSQIFAVRRRAWPSIVNVTRMTREPFGLKAMAVTGPICPSKKMGPSACDLGDSDRQRRAEPRSLAVIRNLPSGGLKATILTAASPPARLSGSAAGLSRCQSLVLPSASAMTRYLPPGLMAAVLTLPLLPRRIRGPRSGCLRSQTRTLSSSARAASQRPSGLRTVNDGDVLTATGKPSRSDLLTTSCGGTPVRIVL